MSEPSPWEKVDHRVHALLPPVGHWAFSPSEQYLAWSEGLDLRAVYITELPSMRTVCTIEGAGALALSWADDETLRVVRGERDRVVVSRHAIPDGGPIGEVSVPRDGLSTTVQTSADGRVVLVRSVSYARLGDAPRGFLVGAAGEDDVDTLALRHPRVVVDRHRRGAPVDCALSPDGRVVAVLHQQLRSPWDATLCFASHRAPLSALTPFPDGNARLLGWVSPTRVLVQHERALLAVERDGDFSRPIKIPEAAAVEGSLDLHPERDQVLLCARVVGDGRYRTLALRARLDGSSPEVTPLSEGRALDDGGVRDGGACWDRDGTVLTLTQSPPGVATLARRPAASSALARLARFKLFGEPPVRLAHFKLIGERPVDLALAPSPRRERFALTWRAFDRGPADPVRRLALFAP